MGRAGTGETNRPRIFDMNPLMSILITTKNGYSKGPRPGEWLTLAIDSALAQDYPNVEVVVCNDGSDDATRETLEEYAGRTRKLIVVNHHLNRGIAAGFNTAQEASLGGWVFPMGDDDILEPNFISVMDSHIRRERAIGNDLSLCGQWMEFIDADGNLKSERAGTATHPDMIRISLSGHGQFDCGVLAASRDAWNALGGYDEKWRWGGDLDFALRAIEANYLIGCTPRVLYKYRTTQGGNLWNVSALHTAEHQSELNEIVRAHQARMVKTGRRMEAPKRGLLHEYRS